MNCLDNYKAIKEEIFKLNATANIIVVTKNRSFESILPIIKSGHLHFGENKVQEMCEKQTIMPKDVCWHFIGHLQTNKVKHIAPFVNLIHSVDSLKLLLEINKHAQKNNRVIHILLQFHIAQEETKFGLNREEVIQLLTSKEYNACQNIRIVGVMGMASFVENVNQIRSEFKELKAHFDFLKVNYFNAIDYFTELSMGMSNDFQIAIQEGSTLIRLGSSIFGER
jgi:pyridoxal phosphate enzyme (YggS family)